MTTYLTSNNAELWLRVPGYSDLLLTGHTADAAGFRYDIKAQDADNDFGSPEAIDTAVQRWMADGAVAATQGYGNRTITLNVVLRADTSVDLAAAEAALARRSGQAGTLKWVSAEGAPDAPATVFEVWTWHFEHVYNGGRELGLSRGYTLTFTAKPAVRSDTLTAITAFTIPNTVTTTLIDACTATTAWTGNPNTPTVVSGAVVESRSVTTGLLPPVGGNNYYFLKLTRTAAVTISPSTPFIQVDATATGGSTLGISSITVDGTFLVNNGSSGTKSWWSLPSGGGGTFTTMVITSIHLVSPLTTTTLTLSVADISQTNTLGGVGSTMQLFRTFPVGGSVKTSGSIQLSSMDGISALGVCAIYTCPNDGSGYVPAMRRYRTTGTTVTADTTAVSGAREILVSSGTGQGTITFSVPTAVIREANYAVVGRFKTSAGSTSINATVRVATGATATGTSFTVPVVFPAASTYVWAPLGIVTLPDLPLPPESTQPTLVYVSASGGTGIQYLDELYLFDITTGAFSLLDSGGAPRLWLDAPDVNPVTNRPGAFTGTVADRSDAIGIPGTSIYSLMAHELAPEGSVIFTVTDLIGGSNVSGSFFERGHTYMVS
jgi:hypothetical protein